MKKLLIIGLIATLSILVGCDSRDTLQEKGEKEQTEIMERARAAHPTPQIDHFLTREAVVEWMETMDKPGKIFYIYVMSDTGSITHYFVAEYRPVSVNTYLTPPERVHENYDWGAMKPAPSLDGTYYGNGGASDQYFFFDAETGAYIELKGLNYIVSDQPIDVDAPKLVVGEEE